jgi:hypothetical protein
MAVFGERLTSMEWIGIGCLGAGLVTISLRAWRARPDAAAPPRPEG